MTKIGQTLLICLFLLWTICPADPLFANVKPIKIGVLAPQGSADCLARWEPTADYLNASLAGDDFVIVPLSYTKVYQAVAERQVDFILLNPSLYVELEVMHGISAILTLINSRVMGGQTRYGGIIFSRADNRAIATIRDLKGKRFMAVDEKSFGGWYAVWRNLREQGIDPYRDFGTLAFASKAEMVLKAVSDGRVDAGSIRTGMMEQQIAAGKIDANTFRIIDRRHDQDYPFLHSTQLYPEWPLAKLSRTPAALCEMLSIALLALKSDDPAAIAGDYIGWTAPLNYRSVHECLMDLRVEPYEAYGMVSLRDAIRQHWHWVLAMLILLGLIIAIAVYVHGLNMKLKKASSKLESELSERQRMEQERERLIHELQEALAKVKTLSGLIPICSNCKKIRDDKGYWHQVEEYIRDHTNAEFSHGLCKECARKLYPEIYNDEE